eukprot:TRINITY_DN240_c3_g4_i2.p1 TRINITY_DN240_c3_g4~~TRINITY_DN240_c3_g4_i2.p1  ORF type:complete len:440 (+),score=37.49 TRINITY_DN240_c3_g4_i2:63-1382(+)
MTDGNFPVDEKSDFSQKTEYSANLNIDFEKYPELKGKDLVGYDGNLYDVTKFVPYHPGGEEILRRFIGKDVSIQVRAFHTTDVLKGRTVVGKYTDLTDKDPAATDYKLLMEKMKSEGLFEATNTWYAIKFFVTFCLFVATVFLLSVAAGTEQDQRGPYLVWSAIALAGFWQQCGFFMHDFMHSQLTHRRQFDRWLGMLFGTAGIGIGGHWWKNEHFLHHAFTNVCDIPDNWSDPQMREDVWAQNRKLFPFFNTWIQGVLIGIQHITWLPITVSFGRIGIAVDCFREERRLYEWAAFAVHWMYVGALLSILPTWSDRGWFYLYVSLGQGVLSIQLLVSHYATPFFHKQEEFHNTSWPRVMIITTLNITNPQWLDWFHGGLNLHIEHHLFPTMPRQHFRAASKHVRSYCQKHGLPYKTAHWTEAIWLTVKHLKRESLAYGK